MSQKLLSNWSYKPLQERFFRSSFTTNYSHFYSATEANNRAGDYLTIMNLQTSTAAIAAIAGTIGVNQLCGGIVAGSATIAQGTICSFTTPFKVRASFHFQLN